MPGPAAAAKFRVHEHAHAAYVTLPAAELLVQCRIADDFTVNQGHERQITA